MNLDYLGTAIWLRSSGKIVSQSVLLDLGSPSAYLFEDRVIKIPEINKRCSASTVHPESCSFCTDRESQGMFSPSTVVEPHRAQFLLSK